jgi:hypothetical protein
MKRIMLVLLLLVGTISSFSQNIPAISDELQLVPLSVNSLNNHGLLEDIYSRSFPAGIIYTSNKEVVFPVWSVKGGEDGIVKMNDELKQLWYAPFTEGIVSIGRLNNNILVLTAKEWDNHALRAAEIRQDPITQLKATLINGVNGKVITEKTIFQNTSGLYIDPKIISDPGNNAKCLLIRYTDYTNANFINKAMDQKRNTSKIDVLQFDETLNAIKPRTLSTSIPGNLFLGSVMNKKGELFIAGCSNDAFFVEKYTAPATSPVQKINTYYDSYKEYRSWGQVTCSRANDDMVIVAFKHKTPRLDRAILTAGFDFVANKATKYDDELNKAYGKQIGFSDVSDLNVMAFESYGDKTIVCKETQGSGTGAGTSAAKFYAGDIVVSVYDKEMKLLKDIVVKRSLVQFTNDQISAGYHVHNDALHIVYSVNGGPAKFKTLHTVIDLDLMQVVKDEEIARDKLPRSAAIEAQAVLWFPNSFVLPYIVDNGTFKSKPALIFQKLPAY